jgi:hypothetical protein
MWLRVWCGSGCVKRLRAKAASTARNASKRSGARGTPQTDDTCSSPQGQRPLPDVAGVAVSGLRYYLNKDRSIASAIALYPASFGWR